MAAIPDNGASMHDAANTREDEKTSFCEGCDKDPETCGHTEKECIEAFEDCHDEAAMEAFKDGAL